MGYTEHWCQGCNGIHAAGFWYYRIADFQGRSYVCGERYNTITDQSGWHPLEPGDPYEDQKIRSCYYCDGPLAGIKRFEQGFHDKCAALRQPSRTAPTGRMRAGGRRKVGRTTSRPSTPRNRR
jgi:hypothetical protein